MRVKVTAPFFDTKREKYAKRGELLTVTKERGKAMIARSLAVAIGPKRKRKKPAEDKARRPLEDKRAD